MKTLHLLIGAFLIFFGAYLAADSVSPYSTQQFLLGTAFMGFATLVLVLGRTKRGGALTIISDA